MCFTFILKEILHRMFNVFVTGKYFILASNVNTLSLETLIILALWNAVLTAVLTTSASLHSTTRVSLKLLPYLNWIFGKIKYVSECSLSKANSAHFDMNPIWLFLKNKIQYPILRLTPTWEPASFLALRFRPFGEWRCESRALLLPPWIDSLLHSTFWSCSQMLSRNKSTWNVKWARSRSPLHLSVHTWPTRFRDGSEDFQLSS